MTAEAGDATAPGCRASVETELATAAGVLVAAGISEETARTDVRLLAAHACGVHPDELPALNGDPMPEVFAAYVERRAAREPAERIVGYAYFMGHRFELGDEVFVPKPESVQVVEDALGRLRALIASGASSPLVVDLCAGPGTMAVSIAQRVPQARVFGVELSQAAAAAARRNARGTGVSVVEGDACAAFPELNGTVDLIVTNPPYIPDGLRSSAPEVLEYDPPLALWAGEDGLRMIRAVERTAARLLAPGGVVLLEHGPYQLESVPALFGDTGRWSACESIPTCNDGYLTAVRNRVAFGGVATTK